MSVLIALEEDVDQELLKCIVSKSLPIPTDTAKLKKPNNISNKNWELGLKVACLSTRLKKLNESMLKYPKDY